LLGKKLFCAEDRRRQAARSMPRLVYDALDGAAGRETSSQENMSALQAIKLQSRVLVNVAERSLKTSFLGRRWDLPFGVAPMGMCDLFWPGADRALAKAAKTFGFPLGVSTMSSSPMEQIIEEAEGNAWFQLYAGQSDDETYALVERAQNSGYQTLILTADVPALPARPRDYRNGFAVPFSMRPNHFVDFACHPKWSLQTLINGIPSPKNVAIQKNNDQPGFRRESGRDRIDWDFLSELRTRWKGNLVLKGVMSCEDAKRATAANVDAVYVSNHGGRQLESAPAAISRLSKIRTVLGDDTSVVFDSGVRNGDDVARALATGADFVMLGRPILYALAGRGEGGLNEFLRLLIDEFSIVMAQLGCTEPAQINHECIASKD